MFLEIMLLIDRYLILSGYEHIITQKPESPDLDDVPASEIPRKIAIGLSVMPLHSPPEIIFMEL